MPEHLKRLEQLAGAVRHRRHRRNLAQWRDAMGLNRRASDATLNRRFDKLISQGRVTFSIFPSRTRSL